ncbi:MAG: hypothetical protein KC708_19615, partial [Anaerolineae bacterium]|nr:hypothetical protein [Anaerolineae bacterium]
EVLSESFTEMGCSWLCSGLEKDMFTLFGIRPNEHGLLNSLEDAMKVYEWIAEDECKGYRAEPEPYFPWLVVSYSIG